MPRFFISFEGGDGSGKSTQTELLKEYFTKKKVKFITTREPGGTNISEKIREILINKENEINPYTEALLYAAARSELVNNIIKPYLESEYTVISDRFLDSALAYQGVARGLGIEKIRLINEFAINAIMPDATFFLDIHPEKALERRKNISDLDRIELEELKFHISVYNGYKELVELYPNRIFSIDANVQEDQIHKNIIKILEERMVLL